MVRQIFVVALLYSRNDIRSEITDDLLQEAFDKIDRDDLLKKTICQINIDNPDARDYMKHNKEKLKVLSWPIFLIRSPDEKTPFIVNIDSYQYVFDLVYEMHDRLQKSISSTVTKNVLHTIINIDNGKDEITVPSGAYVKFISAGAHSLGRLMGSKFINQPEQPRTGYSRVIKFVTPGIYHYASPKDTEKYNFKITVT